MAEVRASVGVPVTANFAGIGTYTICAPIVVDTNTGIAYTLATSDVVTPLASEPTPGINASVTTGTLVGKTMTFVKGILTGFA